MRQHRFTTLPFILILAALPANAQTTITGEVVGIKDGDTIEVMHGGRSVTVRLHGIDAPESAQPFGQAAKQKASDYVFGKVVRVEVTDIDRYGRTVGRIEIGGGELSTMLVRDGLAWSYHRYAPPDTELESLERAARNASRGLWSRRAPIPPWNWRRGVRSHSPQRTAPASSLRYDPDGPDRDCSDFRTHAEAHYFFEAAGASDPHRLDGDDDGTACERLPGG